jgi:hypothetical protein
MVSWMPLATLGVPTRTDGVELPPGAPAPAIGTGVLVPGPRGSRSKLGEQFITDLQVDWRAHGPQVIAAARRDDPGTYMTGYDATFGARPSGVASGFTFS